MLGPGSGPTKQQKLKPSWHMRDPICAFITEANLWDSVDLGGQDNTGPPPHLDQIPW